MSVTIKFDTYELNRQIERASLLMKRAMPAVIKDESRLLLKQSIAFTPPKNQKQGKSAIAADLFSKRGRGLRGVFVQLEPDQLDQPVYANSVRLFARKNGDVYGFDRTNYRPYATDSEMQDAHNAARVGDRGRPSRGGAYTRDVGRWKFIQRMAVGPASAKRYLAKMYKKVGRMKAGWLPAYAALGGEVPRWINQHYSGARGFVVNNLFRDTSKPYFTLGNRSKGIGYLRHAFQSAINVRSKSLKKKIDYFLDGKELKKTFKY